jgi:hypothetical protein
LYTSGSPITKIKIEPLTHRDRAGKPYRRPRKVTNQIAFLLRSSIDDLFIFPYFLYQNMPTEILSEALAYFFRKFFREKNKIGKEKIWFLLADRTADYIRWKLPRFDAEASEEGYLTTFNEILSWIANLPIKIKGRLIQRNGDFFQVRFMSAMRSVVVNVGRKLIRQFNESRELPEENDAIDDLPDDLIANVDAELDIDDDHFRPQPAYSLDQLAVIHDALDQLSKPVCDAFILHWYYGYPISSTNPDNMTVAKKMNKSARTIHNWIAEAEKTLIQWRRA